MISLLKWGPQINIPLFSLITQTLEILILQGLFKQIYLSYLSNDAIFCRWDLQRPYILICMIVDIILIDLLTSF